MIANRVIRLVAMTLILFVGAARAASCELNYVDEDVIEVQVAYKFADRSFQADWVYRSVDPALMIGTTMRRPKSVETVGDAVVALFCITDKERAGPGATWAFATGTRRFSVVPRPTTKVATSLSYSKKEISLYRMPTISLVDPNAPDWTILRNARWQRTNDGELRLDVEFFNPTARTFPGGDVSLTFENPHTIQCKVGPDYREPAPVPVEIRVRGGAIQVASGDPQYGELVHREASHKVEGCFGPAWVRMSIGPSISVPGGQAARTRYAVLYVNSTTGKSELPADFLNWKATLSVSGDEVRPRSLIVEPAAR